MSIPDQTIILLICGKYVFIHWEKWRSTFFSTYPRLTYIPVVLCGSCNCSYPFRRVFVGTVSEFCAKHAECPVITIKRNASEAPRDPVDDWLLLISLRLLQCVNRTMKPDNTYSEIHLRLLKRIACERIPFCKNYKRKKTNSIEERGCLLLIEPGSSLDSVMLGDR